MVSSSYINALVGKQVSVWTTSQSGSKDDGVLEGFDGIVLKLRKEKGATFETLLFPLSNIRLIKANE